jgi:hypothetical protein
MGLEGRSLSTAIGLTAAADKIKMNQSHAAIARVRKEAFA